MCWHMESKSVLQMEGCILKRTLSLLAKSETSNSMFKGCCVTNMYNTSIPVFSITAGPICCYAMIIQFKKENN